MGRGAVALCIHDLLRLVSSVLDSTLARGDQISSVLRNVPWSLSLLVEQSRLDAPPLSWGGASQVVVEGVTRTLDLWGSSSRVASGGLPFWIQAICCISSSV